MEESKQEKKLKENLKRTLTTYKISNEEFVWKEALIAGSSSVIISCYEKIDEHNFRGIVCAVGQTSNNYVELCETIIYADNEKLKKFNFRGEEYHCIYYYDIICKIACFDKRKKEKDLCIMVETPEEAASRKAELMKKVNSFLE